MDPFGDLPPPKHEDEPVVPHKKARAHEAPQPSSASESAQQQRSSVADYLGEREQHEHTLGALRKLAHTLREAKKDAPLRKALQMLAQLMSQPHLEPKHSHDLLAALDASMASRERCSSPGLRAEYIRVFQLALSLRDCVAVKPRDKLRIDAWSIHAVTANELFTDESYEVSTSVSCDTFGLHLLIRPAFLLSQFSRAVRKVKTELEHLSGSYSLLQPLRARSHPHTSPLSFMQTMRRPLRTEGIIPQQKAGRRPRNKPRAKTLVKRRAWTACAKKA
jgi:hypothetical protein